MRSALAWLKTIDVGPGGRGYYPAMLVGLWLGYAVVLTITFGLGPLWLLTNSIVNIMPIAVLGLAARAVLRHFVFGRPAAFQAVGHAGLAMLWTTLQFWMLMVLLGATQGRNAVTFSVQPFLAPVAAWQLFQGMFIYAGLAMAAALELAAQRARAAPPAEPRDPAREGEPFRLFVRRDDEILPIDPGRIILVRGADDYAEIVTATATHLVRMTLATLAERLGARFIRVHRSCLVNVDRISKAEPAGGGRMLVHMESGEMITTSRTGARLLRERIV